MVPESSVPELELLFPFRVMRSVVDSVVFRLGNSEVEEIVPFFATERDLGPAFEGEDIFIIELNAGLVCFPVSLRREEVDSE